MSKDLIPAEPRVATPDESEALWRRLTPSKGETVAGLLRSGRASAADEPAIRSALADVSRPAAERERVALLEALFQHYPARNLGPGEKQFWLDWLMDTRDLPASVLADACGKWRRSAERFAPSPGQLLGKVDPAWRYRIGLAQSWLSMLNVDTVVDTPAKRS